MAFMNVKAATFLIGKEGFDPISTLVITAGLVLVFQVAEQIDGIFIAAAPLPDQVDLHRIGLCKPSLPILHDALFLQRHFGNGVLSLWAMHVNLRRCA
jgi:hypothetical protein